MSPETDQPTPTTEADPEDAAHEAVYGHAETRHEALVSQGIAVLAQLAPQIIDRFLPGASVASPVAGRIDCIDCQGQLSDLRAALVGLEQHLESVHDWWPAEMDGVFLDSHKAVSKLARGLRGVRHIARIQGDSDPYAMVRESEPDQTGTPANSRERLDAVLAARGPAPLYDPITGELDPGDAIERPIFRVADDPGTALDGGGDVAPVPEYEGDGEIGGLGAGEPARPELQPVSS